MTDDNDMDIKMRNGSIGWNNEENNMRVQAEKLVSAPAILASAGLCPPPSGVDQFLSETTPAAPVKDIAWYVERQTYLRANDRHFEAGGLSAQYPKFNEQYHQMILHIGRVVDALSVLLGVIGRDRTAFEGLRVHLNDALNSDDSGNAYRLMEKMLDLLPSLEEERQYKHLLIPTPENTDGDTD